ncbi:RNA-binding protein 42-like [Sesbania bispinosa]|nr:RNA-binding protein 42-like [Sesbania bispinosa]
MVTPSSSPASQLQFAYSNTFYFPVPFHLQEPAAAHYAALYVSTAAVQVPAPPVAGVPQYQVGIVVRVYTLGRGKGGGTL